MLNYVYRPSLVYHPAPSLLPPGFKFPEEYLEYVNRKEVDSIYPWSFLCHAWVEGYFDWWAGYLKEQYPDRQLVPFAKWNLDDDVACFELTGNPKYPGLHIIHTFTDPGYEQRGYNATFAEWLRDSKEEAEAFQTDEPEQMEEIVSLEGGTFRKQPGGA